MELIYHERTVVTTIEHKHARIIAGRVEVITTAYVVDALSQAYVDVHSGQVKVLHTMDVEGRDDLCWLTPSGLTSRCRDRFAAIKHAVLGAARWQDRIADTLPVTPIDADVIAQFLADEGVDAASNRELVDPFAYSDTLLGIDDSAPAYWERARVLHDKHPSYRTTRELRDVALAA